MAVPPEGQTPRRITTKSQKTGRPGTGPGPGTATGRAAGGTRDLVLGLVSGYRWEQLRPFFDSLRAVGFDGETRIFWDRLDPATVAAMEARGARLTRFHRARWPLCLGGREVPTDGRIGRLLHLYPALVNRLPGAGEEAGTRRLSPFGVRFFHVVNIRYLLFYRFLLTAGPGRYRNVLLTDVRDVLFQRPPFAGGVPDAVSVFLEDAGITMASDANYRGWVRAPLGEAFVRKHLERPVSCCALTLAPYGRMLAYLRRMAALITGPCASGAYQFGLDSAVHNRILWEGEVEGLRPVENAAGPVVHLGGVDPASLGGAPPLPLRGRGGGILPIVHQYDRHPDLARRLLAALDEDGTTPAEEDSPARRPETAPVPVPDPQPDPEPRATAPATATAERPLRPMCLGFVCGTYTLASPYGGIDQTTRANAEALARRGHEVHVVTTLVPGRRDLVLNGVRVHVRPLRWLPVLGRYFPGLGETFGLARALLDLDRRHGFDLVEIPNWEGVGFATFLLGQPPALVRHHTAHADSFAATGRRAAFPQRFLVALERAAVTLARHHLTHSRYQQAVLARTFGLRHVPVIAHGIAPPGGDETQEVTVPETVLALGNLNPRKGAPTLLEAAATVLRARPAARFWLVGTDPENRSEREFRRRFPEVPAGAVRFTGFVPQEEADRFLGRCAVYVSPSVYESFGMTFLEAMRRGKPVIGCDASAVPEIVRHRQNGLLVPPNDPAALAAAVLTLLQDPQLARRLGQHGRELAAGPFSIERTADAYEELLRASDPGGPQAFY